MVVNQEQLTTRPQAELLIAMINDPNRVEKQYLISRGPRYPSPINDFDLSLHPLGIKFNFLINFATIILVLKVKTFLNIHLLVFFHVYSLCFFMYILIFGRGFYHVTKIMRFHLPVPVLLDGTRCSIFCRLNCVSMCKVEHLS